MTAEPPDPERRARVHGLLDALEARVPEGVTARAHDVAAQLAAREVGGLAPGDLVGPWEVLAPVGQGGQATVYRARHRHLGRDVALKVPRNDLAARLLREARLAAGLAHPRIVAVEDVAPEAEWPYMVLEWCPGGSLAELLARSPGGLPLDRVVAVSEAVLGALACAHAHGVVHCDVKPANILFDAAGNAKVSDFGVGRVAAEEAAAAVNSLALTGPGGFAGGTPAYMAPEQERPSLLSGAPLDGRADLFAFGRVLFEMLTGASGRTVRPPSRVRAGLDPLWDEIVFRLLEEKRDARYATAGIALAAIQSVGGQSVSAAPSAESALRSLEAMRPAPVAAAQVETMEAAPRGGGSGPRVPPGLPYFAGRASGAVLSALRGPEVERGEAGATPRGGGSGPRVPPGLPYIAGRASGAVLSALRGPEVGPDDVQRARATWQRWLRLGAALYVLLPAVRLWAGYADAPWPSSLLTAPARGPASLLFASAGAALAALALASMWRAAPRHPRFEALFLDAALGASAFGGWTIVAGIEADREREVNLGLALFAGGLFFTASLLGLVRSRHRAPGAPAPVPPTAQPARAPGLFGRILAVVLGLASVAGAVLGGAALVFMAFLVAIARSCNAKVSPGPAEIDLLAAAVVAAGAIGAAFVIWGAVGLIRRALARRRGA